MKVMQCWDDSTENDIRLVKLFRRYDAKATFNVIVPDEDGGYGHDWTYQDFTVSHIRLREMKDLYAGFRVAGHGGRCHRLIPATVFEEEARFVKQCITEHLGQDECGYAYPGGGFNAEIKDIIRRLGYRYARTTANVEGVLPLSDPFELPSHCHFAHEQFWEKFAAVKRAGGIFYFWGHSYELKNDQKLWDGLEQIMDRIAADPSVAWLDIIDLFRRDKPFSPSSGDTESPFASGGAAHG